MKPEQLLWALVKPYFPGHCQRIENAAGVGAPDVNFCYNASEVWVELKVDTLNKNIPVIELLRPEQKVWHYKHVINLGKVYVLVRAGMRLTLYKTTGPSKNSVTCNYVSVWSETKPWRWETFEAIMRSL